MESLCHSRCCTLKNFHCSMVISAEVTIWNPSQVMMTSTNEWNVLNGRTSFSGFNEIVLIKDVCRIYKITICNLNLSVHTAAVICLFVCIFVAVHLENGDAKIIADEGLQIKTYAKYSWPLNSKCYTYFTGHQVFNVTSYNQWYLHLLPSVW